eukprot:gene19181-biopygen41944
MSGKAPTVRTMPAIVDGARTLTDDAEKAECFARTYAGVSRLPPADRAANTRLKRQLSTELERNDAPLEGFDAPFTMLELDTVLNNLSTGKAAGLDGLSNEMLKRLGPTGKAAMLRTVNASWETGAVPAAWRTAEIVPIAKKGKDPNRAGSYRPISLTSCLAKAAERIVRERLNFVIESRGLLQPEQAG